MATTEANTEYRPSIKLLLIVNLKELILRLHKSTIIKMLKELGRIKWGVYNNKGDLMLITSNRRIAEEYLKKLSFDAAALA